MTLIPLPPIGLLAPIVTKMEDVHVCEAGIYPDKFGQIHSHQLYMWAGAFKDYIPMFLEHQPFTWPFFGYVYGMRAHGTSLFADFALTRYGLQALYDYRENHMGSGWSIGVLEGKTGIGEITLCRQPRVASTHVVTLENVSFDKLAMKHLGARDINGNSSDIGDQIVQMVRDIVEFESRGNEQMALQKMKELQEFMYCNNIHIPGTSVAMPER